MKAVEGQDSVQYGIDKLKSFDMVYVLDDELGQLLVKDFNNYSWLLGDDGTALNVPDKKKYDPEQAETGSLLIELIAITRQAKAINRIALNEPIKQVTITLPKEKIPLLEPHIDLLKFPLHVSEIKFLDGKELTAKINID